MGQTSKIYIYGAGGHGKVVADIARNAGYLEVIFLDDSMDNKFSADLEKFDIIVAIGDNKIRQKVINLVLKSGFNLVSLIHKSAVVSKSAKIGRGVVVMPNVVVNSNANIGNGVILNTSSVVEHDCEIGRFAHISPMVCMAGGVRVGECSHIGIGSSIIERIKIGSNCVIGAGSVVVCDFFDNSKAYGVPAKLV